MENVKPVLFEYVAISKSEHFGFRQSRYSDCVGCEVHEYFQKPHKKQREFVIIDTFII